MTWNVRLLFLGGVHHEYFSVRTWGCGLRCIFCDTRNLFRVQKIGQNNFSEMLKSRRSVAAKFTTTKFEIGPEKLPSPKEDSLETMIFHRPCMS